MPVLVGSRRALQFPEYVFLIIVAYDFTSIDYENFLYSSFLSTFQTDFYSPLNIESYYSVHIDSQNNIPGGKDFYKELIIKKI